MNSVTIGGKDRPVNIGWGMLKEFGKLTGRTFGQVFEVADLTFDDIEKLLYAGLKWGARREGQEFDVKLKDIGGWLDDDIQAVTDFMVIFQEELTASLKNVPAPEAGP